MRLENQKQINILPDLTLISLLPNINEKERPNSIVSQTHQTSREIGGVSEKSQKR